jgi:hypothetical protein
MENNGYSSLLFTGNILKEKNKDDFSKNLLFCKFIDISESNPLKKNEFKNGVEEFFVDEFSSKKTFFSNLI